MRRRHADVDDRDVRKVLAGGPEEPIRVANLSDHLEARVDQNTGDARAHKYGVVCKDETQRHPTSASARMAAPEICSLEMKPSACPFVRRLPYARASRLEVSTTNGGGPSIARLRATSNPSTSGRPMSSSTKSGRRAATASRPDAPSTASPITRKPSASRRSRAWVRKRASSS